MVDFNKLWVFLAIIRIINSITIVGDTNHMYGTSRVTLTCFSFCVFADITWTTTATSSDELDYIDSDVSSILTITHVKLDHMGNYTCIVNDTVTGAITEATVTLTVYVPAPVVTTPLTILIANHSHGDNINVILTCTFQSLTTPSITWSTSATNQVLPNPTLSSSSSSYTSVLMLNNITLDNEDLYTCTATNEGGMIQSSARLVDILAPDPEPDYLTPLGVVILLICIFAVVLLVPVLVCFIPAHTVQCIRDVIKNSNQQNVPGV